MSDDEGGGDFFGGGDEGGGMFGDGDSDYDGDDVGEDSPCAKIGTSLVCMCIGLIGFPMVLFGLGANEKNYVCNDKTILYAEDRTVTLPCDTNAAHMVAKDGFGYLQCPVRVDGMETFNWCSFNGDCPANANSLMQFTSSAGYQEVEISQCTESCTTTKSKQGGRNVKTTTCDYSLEWTTQRVSSDNFHDKHKAVQACRLDEHVGNPFLPSNMKTSPETKWAVGPLRASDVKEAVPITDSNSYTIPSNVYNKLGLIHDVEIVCPVCKNKAKETVDHIMYKNGEYLDPFKMWTDGSFFYSCRNANDNTAGCIRVSYRQGLILGDKPSILAHFDERGTAVKQDVPSSWGCGKSSTFWIRFYGIQTSFEQMLEHLRAENTMALYGFRIGLLIAAFFTVYCWFCPCMAIADVIGDFLNYIPCVGGYMEDMLEAGASYIACGLACCIGPPTGIFIMGLVWLAMRPVVGLCVLLLGCCCCGIGGAIAYSAKQYFADKPKRRKKKKVEEDGVEEGLLEDAVE